MALNHSILYPTLPMSTWSTKKTYEDITYKVREGVARIAFNRPEVRNAFNDRMIEELTEEVFI